jgi:hypothetical protein
MEPYAGIIALVGAVLGIVATIVAPSLFLKSARISADVVSARKISRKSPSDSVSIVVTHNDKPILGDVYTVDAVIKNTGNTDLVSEQFSRPVEFDATDGVRILAADVKAPITKIDAVADVSADALKIKWALLKPREKILITMVVASGEATTAEKIAKSVVPSARMVDVKVGKGFWLKNRWLAAALVGYAFGFFLLAIFAFTLRLGTNHYLVFNEQDRTNLIRIGADTIEVCDISGSILLPVTCSSTTEAAANDLLKSAKIENARFGLLPYEVWILLLGPLSYALLAIIPSRLISRMLNRFRRKQGGADSDVSRRAAA